MKHPSLSSWAARFAPRFERYVPRNMSAAWLARFVDRPRFGWDLAGLDTGFTQPLYRFIDGQPLPQADGPLSAHSRFMRSALCCELIRALPGGQNLDPLAFDMEMSALELHAVSSTMLDHLDNGRDLAASQGREAELALPVLITVAYSARQLAASMLWGETAVSGDHRDTLQQRFGRLLILQGIGHTLDIWGGGAQLQHHSVDGLAEHLRWYFAPLDFELTCELAAAAADLSNAATSAFVRAGSDLGLAWHCALALVRLNREWPASVPPLRWKALADGSLPQALSTIAARSRREGLDALHRIAPAAATVFDCFLTETLSETPTDARPAVEAL